jgi:ParB family chromosome partitioning protein
MARSILAVGLLEPIVVAPTDTDNYEILMGQRRYLAHKLLGKSTISAIVTGKVDDITAKRQSIVENTVRRNLNRSDLIDACTTLYKHYGSIKEVAARLGVRTQVVTQHIKYERLAPQLRRLVDDGSVPLNAALDAQDVASARSIDTPDGAVRLAQEMAPMTVAQRKSLIKEVASGQVGVEKLVRAAKTDQRLIQVIVALKSSVHSALHAYASKLTVTQPVAAARLIEEALMQRGRPTNPMPKRKRGRKTN